MDLKFSAEDEAFRDEVKAWIAAEFDEDLRQAMSQTKNGYLDKDRLTRWQKKLATKGWLAVDWPVEYGGPGFTPTQRYLWGVEMAAAHVPPTIPFGVRMCAPVLMAFGSEAQKAEHLPAMRNFDRWWCQGYSEPGSGSDLAALQMRADRDGEDYILNGSKIWTTLAQHADWIFCLVRTSQEAKRQDGISFVLVDMTTPGISVRPLPTLEGPLEGLQEINQVFFDNVRVPVKNRVGEEGKGWTYAKYLLEFERGNAYAPGLSAQLKKVKAIAAKAPGDGGRADPEGPGLPPEARRYGNPDRGIKRYRTLGLFRPRIRRADGRHLVHAEVRGVGDAAGHHRTGAGGGRPLCDALCGGWPGRADLERVEAGAGARLDRGRILFQLPQDLDLCGLERDPAQHHGQGAAGALTRTAGPLPAWLRT